MRAIRTANWLRLLAITAVATWSAPASAQQPEIRFARQFSMSYLQFNLMERLGLLEKHAKAMGVDNLKVTWATFNGPNAMNDALLSNNVDIVSGGVPGLLTLWAKTRNTPLAVKGVAAFTSQPILLNTRNPNVKTIADFTAADKIALPAVKVSIQAILLHMAAAKQWGPSNYSKLDQITVAMSPPDSTVAMLSGAADITSNFSVPPFQYQQLESPGIHTVLNSFEVFGAPHTLTVAWASSQFREKNPIVFKALVKAWEEATGMLGQDLKQASQFWIDDVKSKLPVEKVVAVASGKDVTWTMTPQNTLKFGDFMHSVGTIKEKPADWKDMFFPEIHHLPGS